MATKFLKKREVAKLVTENRKPCVFCNQDVDDEVIYGKLYSYGDIQCHYFCVLLSCCLVQKGRDSEGLFGFLYKDILAEVERSKKHKCSYCGRGGASLGCSVAACRKQFHLPCGRQKNAVSLFYGNYKSFCELHAPKQKISDDVMAKAKERMKIEKLKKAGKIPVSDEGNQQAESPEDPAMVCVICYEPVPARPTTQTFWPPCCGRDAWLHRSCLQRMALSAGMHYLKCPLCNDKDNFYDAVCEQGYYLPDRDAAWELEQNAFAEIYNRDASCAAAECKCPFGRSHDELGTWDIKLCLLCGSWGLHAGCGGGQRAVCAACRPAATDMDELETRLASGNVAACGTYSSVPAGGSWGLHAGCGGGQRAVCAACRPAATDMDELETRLASVIMAEQAREQQRTRSGPVMPSRMSLRRTKGRLQPHSASSSSQILPTHETQVKTESHPTDRLELNLKTPRRPKLLTPSLLELEARLLSPAELLQLARRQQAGRDVLDKIRLRFSKPRPLSAKKKIINDILDDLFKNMLKENPKSKDPVREWNSPKKSCDITTVMNEAVKEFMEPTLNTNKEVQENTEEKSMEVDEENDKKEHERDRDNLGEEKSDIVDGNSSDKENNINQNNGNDNVKSDDESSSSTFQLAPEFIADSDDGLPIIDTPKKLKMVDIKQDSIEISKKDEIVNVDVMQVDSGRENEFVKNLDLKGPVKNKMFSFKFSPLDKEPLKTDVDMDVESFKDRYLNEIDRDKCVKKNERKKEVDSTDKKCKKRKLEMKEEVRKKRKKDSKKRKKIKLKIKAIDPEKAGKKRTKKIKKIKEHKKIIRDNVSIKIRLKDGNSKTKKLKKIQKVKSYKQYVLKYSPLLSSNIAKPEIDVTPMKRKYTKIEKSPSDKLVQTSIQSFFKAK
ncbi:uncharacterized protein LOC133532820 [Cydia pomonella]|uniref:uncharacterized protein LOC133532820 n=1 Tax=Cydia pomonella TaxID=82600 RepID=UPI002ADE62FC|nr:uncharacterized protein LOC133532820 [Cydia pomonella]